MVDHEIGQKLVCEGCGRIHDYMTMENDDDDGLACPDCGGRDWRRLDEDGRQGPWELEQDDDHI